MSGSRIEDARFAGALARLLRWEAKLLAREDHDPASRAAALRGLEWAADFARALDAETCATWLDALRERGAERPGHTPRVWRALGAPVCVELADRLDEEKVLAPLLPEARGWRGMATAVRAYEELNAPPQAAQAVDEERTEPRSPVAETPEPVASVDLASPPFRFGDRVQVPADTRVPGDPIALRSLFAALAEWSGPYGAQTLVRGGRVELSGARPSEHAEPGRIAEPVLESLRLLHLAAARVAAPLVVDDPAEGAVRWLVRLPAADDPRHLFAEAAGRKIALPWHAVVAYGLGEGGRPHVVLGRGLERIAVGLDWLHGLGGGRRIDADAADTATDAPFLTPALALLPGAILSDEGERYVEVALRPLAPVVTSPTAEQPPRPIDPPIEPPLPAPAEPPIDPPAPTPERPPIDPPQPPPILPPRPPPPPAPPEALQGTAPPADISREAVSTWRALVADDSFTARVFLRRLLAMRGIAVDEAGNGDEARSALEAGRYDLVFLDADMPGGGALAIAPAIPAADRERVVVLVRDEAERSAAVAAGFAQALYKPFAEDEVAAALSALAEVPRPGA